MSPHSIAAKLVRATASLRFAAPVTHVYNPLDYARKPHREYLERFGAGTKEVLFVGMNPGPFGMAQTGVPFGDVAMVRDWMGIDAPVSRPNPEHPKRPVTGFACTRSEVSGTRLWGWARDRFGTPERFFARFFVWNYCPLCFLEGSGRNRTPNKLPAAERESLFAVCDDALRALVSMQEPLLVVGIGKFAHDRARSALDGYSGTIGQILHPSPASPLANKGWKPKIEGQLRALSVQIPE